MRGRASKQRTRPRGAAPGAATGASRAGAWRPAGRCRKGGVGVGEGGCQLRACRARVGTCPTGPAHRGGVGRGACQRRAQKAQQHGIVALAQLVCSEHAAQLGQRLGGDVARRVGPPHRVRRSHHAVAARAVLGRRGGGLAAAAAGEPAHLAAAAGGLAGGGASAAGRVRRAAASLWPASKQRSLFPLLLSRTAATCGARARAWCAATDRPQRGSSDRRPFLLLPRAGGLQQAPLLGAGLHRALQASRGSRRSGRRPIAAAACHFPACTLQNQHTTWCLRSSRQACSECAARACSSRSAGASPPPPPRATRPCSTANRLAWQQQLAQGVGVPPP